MRKKEERCKICPSHRLKLLFLKGVENLEKNKRELDQINVFPVKDRDTGKNLVLTLNPIKEKIRFMKFEKAGDLLKEIARFSLYTCKGCSGSIFSAFLFGFSKDLEEKKFLDPADFILGFENGYNFAYQSIESPQRGTILSAMEVAKKAVLYKNNLYEILENVYFSLKEYLPQTRQELEVLKENDVEDSGAKGFFYFIEGMYKFMSFGPKETFSFYCLQVLIEDLKIPPDSLKRKLRIIAKDIIINSQPPLLKVHLHTESLQEVFEILEKYGKICNFSKEEICE